MPKYAVTVYATITGTGEFVAEVEADNEAEAREEAEALAENAIFGWSIVTATLNVKSGTCSAEKCELVEGTEDE